MSDRPFPCRSGSSPSSLTTSPNRIAQGVRQKKQIVHQLIEGRISLLEAVARFQAVHRSSTAKLEKSLGVSASPTDPESMARAVIGWVHLELSDRPEHAEAVSGRLERELQRSLDRTGKLSLPSVN